MIPKSGNRFSEKIMLEQKAEHDPEKWKPVFGKDHAQIKEHDPVLKQKVIPTAIIVDSSCAGLTRASIL